MLLWTRAEPINGIPDVDVPVCVSFKIFNNPQLSGKPLDSGEGFTTYDVDFTVKFEAQNLQADSKYWYQFADCTNVTSVSPIGATRTLPHPDSKRMVYVQPPNRHPHQYTVAPADQVNGGKPLTLAVFSCSQFQNGTVKSSILSPHLMASLTFSRLVQRVRCCCTQHQCRNLHPSWGLCALLHYYYSSRCSLMDII